MPKIDHPNIGNISKTRYLTGTITEITDGDTCSLNVNGQIFESVPIFYHCNNDVTLQANGSLEGGSGAFAKDDSVIVQNHNGQLRVLGHADGVKRPCATDWLFRIKQDGVLVDPSSFLSLPFIPTFSITFRDAGSSSDENDPENSYVIKYDINDDFAGYTDNSVRGRTIGEPDFSDGSYDSVTKTMKFASKPKNWDPIDPLTATLTYRAFTGTLFVTYPDIVAEDYVNGTVIRPGGSNPGPIFTFLFFT